MYLYTYTHRPPARAPVEIIGRACIYRCIHVNLYACISICISTYVYIYIYIYIHIILRGSQRLPEVPRGYPRFPRGSQRFPRGSYYSDRYFPCLSLTSVNLCEPLGKWLPRAHIYVYMYMYISFYIYILKYRSVQVAPAPPLLQQSPHRYS